MKSNFKLQFKDKTNIHKFSFAFTQFLLKRRDWAKECDFFTRKDNVYVDTADYTAVAIWLSLKRNVYGYNLIEIRR